MTDDREPFREARAAGLKARHERRLENATYTAAEVKVLTEAALRLGRAEVIDELKANRFLRKDIANRVNQASKRIKFGENDGQPRPIGQFGRALTLEEIFAECGEAADDILAYIVASQPSPDATSGRTDPEAK